MNPKEIADATFEAAKAGTPIALIHARDSETGQRLRVPKLFEGFVDQIRESGTNEVFNITDGMGEDWISGRSNPAKSGPTRI